MSLLDWCFSSNFLWNAYYNALWYTLQRLGIWIQKGPPYNCCTGPPLSKTTAECRTRRDVSPWDNQRTAVWYKMSSADVSLNCRISQNCRWWRAFARMYKMMQFTSFKVSFKEIDLTLSASWWIMQWRLINRLLSYSFDTYPENLATKFFMLPVIAGAPSLQIPHRFFNSSLFLMQAFFAATNMPSPRVREESVFMERRSSHYSKVGFRERINTSSCAESLMSVDSSTARENKLASLLTFVCREKNSCLAISSCRRWMVLRERASDE